LSNSLFILSYMGRYFQIIFLAITKGYLFFINHAFSFSTMICDVSQRLIQFVIQQMCKPYTVMSYAYRNPERGWGPVSYWYKSEICAHSKHTNEMYVQISEKDSAIHVCLCTVEKQCFFFLLQDICIENSKCTAASLLASPVERSQTQVWILSVIQ